MFPLTNKEPYIMSTGERTTLGDVLTKDDADINHLKEAKADKSNLSSISITGTTNSTGSTIATGTYFYLNGALVKAKISIANGATLTLNTNYEIVTAGALNELSSLLNLLYYPNSLLSGIDLNDIKTTGCYALSGNIANNAGNNNYGVLIVFKFNANFVKQIQIALDTESTYIRTYNNGTWGGWKQYSFIS